MPPPDPAAADPGDAPRVCVDLAPGHAAAARSLWRLLPPGCALHVAHPATLPNTDAPVSLTWPAASWPSPPVAGKVVSLVWPLAAHAPDEAALAHWRQVLSRWQATHAGLTGLLRPAQLPEPGDHRALEALIGASLQTGCPLTLDLHAALARAYLDAHALDHAARMEAAVATVHQAASQLPGRCVGQLEVGGQQHWRDATPVADQRVPEALWRLVESLCAVWGPREVLVKWQGDAPAMAVLADEARLARLSQRRHARGG